ncbi:MAG: hypothetical protein GX247_02590 [Mollicutes bacterium]|nr:hypothetical protein [Mollicutes bacterium]
MVRLGKLPNGIGLFNFKKKMKIVLQTDNMKNILACFDNSYAIQDVPKKNDIDFIDFDVLKDENKEIYDHIDSLFMACRARIMVYEETHSYFDIKRMKFVSYYQKRENGISEIRYPTDDDIPNDKKTFFGITKYNDFAYSLTLYKLGVNGNNININNNNKNNITSVCIKYRDQHDSDLYTHYKTFLKSLHDLAIEDFEKVNEEFEAYAKANQNNDKQLVKQINKIN